MELDFSFGIRGLARFRCNVFNQRGAVAAVYRLIPEKIRSFSELGLPAVIATLSERPRGLVLVTGPDRQRQVDDAGRDARQDQYRAARPHHHHRRSDRVHPPAQELPGQPARGPQRHGELHERAARGAPRRPRHRAHRRNARSRNGRGGAADCRDRASHVRHACTRTRRRRPSIASSTSFPRASNRRSAPSCRWCSRASSARRFCREPTARDASRPWKSWCRRRPSAT